MTILNKKNIVFAIIVCFYACHSSIKSVNFPVWLKNVDSISAISIIEKDKWYVEILKNNFNNVKAWNLCIKVLNNKICKEFYSETIYFKGEIDNTGCKIGIWEGYIDNTLVIKMGYIGCIDGINKPLFLKIWDKKGKLKNYFNFNII